jgi:hypothetical protein
MATKKFTIELTAREHSALSSAAQAVAETKENADYSDIIEYLTGEFDGHTLAALNRAIAKLWQSQKKRIK